MNAKKLRPVPPLPTDERCWRRLLNVLYLAEEDELFRWAQLVRQVVEENERTEAA